MNTVRIIPEQIESSNDGAFADFIDLRSIVDFIKRYSISITVSTIVGILIASLYILTSDKLYWARTEILIEPKLHQLQQPVSDINLSLDTSQLESQIAVLKSERIAAMVVDQLNLAENDAFLESANTSLAARAHKLFALLSGSDPAAAPETDDNAMQASDSAKQVPDSVPQDSGGVTQAPPAKNAELADGSPDAMNYERYRSTIELLERRLTVRREGVSYAIEIAFSAHSPALAADVANAVAQSFLREQIDSKSRGAKEGSLWLEKRLQELRNQMNLATQAAQSFRARHDYRIGAETNNAGVVPGKDFSEILQDRLKGPTLEELEVTADTYRKIYESVLQAYMGSVSQQSYPSADARVITAASPPLASSLPRKKLVLAFGAFGGIMFGVAFAFARQMLDDRIISPQQLWNEVGLNCLGDLPSPPHQWLGKQRLDVITRYPRSAYVKALMSLGTTLRLLEGNTPLRFIGVASAELDSRKGEFACHLAAMYERKGLNTLVVNADPANSSLTNGLQTSFLLKPVGDDNETKSAKSGIRAVAGQSFDYLPSGTSLHAQLMKSGEDDSALDQLKSYKMVIVELPPTTLGVDAFPMESVLDGVVIVAEYGKSRVDALADLLNSLMAMRVSVLGAVIMNVHARSRRSYNRLPVSVAKKFR